MKINNKNPIKHIIPLFLIISIIISSCGPLAYKRADVKDVPVNEADKRKKNIEEGRGATFKFGKRKSGTFDFASSNEMWRATIDVLDFAPLVNADYGGGIIITDWYSEYADENESIKISVQFLSNEIRIDGLKVLVYKKKCTTNQSCKITKIDSKINQEIKMAIVKKAALIKKSDKKNKGGIILGETQLSTID
jgi:hypothetical protein